MSATPSAAVLIQIRAVIQPAPTIRATIAPRGAAGWLENSQIDGGRADSTYAATLPVDGGTA